MSEPGNLDLQSFVRDIPDFPKPGILFRDITPLLSSPQAFRYSIHQMCDPFRSAEIDVIVAAEARGFVFAAPMALELNTSFVPIRKPGKLPFERHSFSYDLEYGSDTLEMHVDGVSEGQNVLVVDDLLATGGTVEACCTLLEKCGAKVHACAFLIELCFLQARDRLPQYEVHSVIKYDD